jgi:hypothetical protein
MAKTATFCGHRSVLRTMKGDRMLTSGHGRHRRPRQAPTAIVTVAATGAGIALPFLAVTGAQAADTATWTAVATCESGGLWSANAGNGFYGGLQISQETWTEYGGTVYADRPDLASIAQQITVAEKILAVLGPDAWPGCATTAGLTRGGATPSVDPGSVVPSDSATGTGDGTATTVPPTGTDSPAATGTASPSPSASASASASSTATAGTADPAQGQGSQAPPPAQPSAGDGATGDSGTVGVLPDLAETVSGAIPRVKSSSEGLRTTSATNVGTYVVQAGDSLCGIAAAQDVNGGWRALYKENAAVIGDDASVINPGELLQLG